jgi:hypothetical protein
MRLASVYFALLMFANVRPERWLLLNFIAPFALLMPWFWTREGNAARVRALAHMAIFGLCFWLLGHLVRP